VSELRIFEFEAGAVATASVTILEPGLQFPAAALARRILLQIRESS
jgi:hypothetical protein